MSQGQARDLEIEARATEILARFGNVPVPLAVVDLSEMRVRAVNPPLLELTGLAPEDLLGWATLDLVQEERRAIVRSQQEAIADGRLEGFQAGQVFQLPNGVAINAMVWARRLVVDDLPWGLAVVLPAEEGRVELPHAFAGAGVDMMMAVTDHDWVIAYSSADARHVLDTGATDLIGEPLLGLVHPGDGANFMTSVASAASSKCTVACRARLRARGTDWREVTCFVSALCEHSPPRIGLGVTGADDTAKRRVPEPERKYEQVLWRIAMELRAAGLTSDEPAAITRSAPELAARLSVRQWEIVHRLAQGQDTPRIASSMYLSASTVRNHLSAIYRKFGVHSQVQLLALLRDGILNERPVPVPG